MPLESTKVNPVSFANPKWFKDKTKSSIWVRGYRMMRVPQTQLPNGSEIVDLGNVRALFIRGVISYIDTPAPPKTGPEGVIHLGGISAETAPRDTYLLLMTPHAIDSNPGSEQRSKDLISSAAGFLSLLGGHNIVYTHLFDNTLNADGTGMGVNGRAVVTPNTLPATDLSESSIREFRDVATSLEDLPEAENHRIKLSLRWFTKDEGVGGVDEFLSRWIALETLAMPDTTNIRPANDLLGRIYGISSQQAAEKFLLGRLCDLRARIVHDGATPPISSRLLDYVAALYRDLVSGTIGITSPRAAELALAESGSQILEALAKTRTG